MRKPWVYGLLFFFFPFVIRAQAHYDVGILPEFNFSTRLSKLWALDAEVASRFETLSGTFGSTSQTAVTFSLVDITTVFNRTVGVDAKVGAGYLARFRNKTLVHRFIQQYAFTNPYYGFRLGHRFRVDETFVPDEAVEIRLRYRLSSDMSLNGEFIDPGELYIKVAHEYVYSIQNNSTDLEIRLVPILGYYLDDDHKLELGIDYRIDTFLNATAAHQFWLNVGYYLSL